MRLNYFFLGFFVSLNLVAHIKYEEGYIIKNNGDTIFGYLNTIHEIRNVKECFFTSDQDIEAQKYLPFEIAAYRYLDGRFFVSKKIDINGEELSVFAEYLVNGVIDTYYLRLNDKERYILEKDNEKPFIIEGEELKYSKTNVPYMSNAKSIGGLKYLMNGNEVINKKIDQISFNQKSLIKITKEYHDLTCNEYECILYAKKVKNDLRGIGIISGLTVSKSVFNSEFESFDNITKSITNNTLNYLYGFNFYGDMPWVNKKLISDIYLTMMNYSQNFNYKGETYNSANNISFSRLSVKYSLGYKIFKNEEIYIYPTIGFANDLIFNIKEDFSFELTQYELDLPIGKVMTNNDTSVEISYEAGFNCIWSVTNLLNLKFQFAYNRMLDFDNIILLSSYQTNCTFQIGIYRSLVK